VRRGPRGGPGALGARLARAEQLLDDGRPGAAGAPLEVVVAVLRHQQARAGVAPAAPARSDAGRFPLLDLERAAPSIVSELAPAVAALRGAVPPTLAEAGDHLQALAPSEAAAVVETWFDDVALVEPRLAFWVQVAAGPVLESGADRVAVPDEWTGAACPVCGGQPQASVIAEESGEFMAGSPRSLVCGRCATWWPYARITCALCGEEDSRLIESFLVEGRRSVRVDTCATCRGYVKTFDLRQPGAVDIVPLVDDVATLTLDVWAQQRGLRRSASSLAGV
jgi:formate dehydrogenase accessory protein FdhE